ncbi:MAG TPA: alpha/beta hydrolase-fold protein [Chloroflexota bacterium]
MRWLAVAAAAAVAAVVAAACAAPAVPRANAAVAAGTPSETGSTVAAVGDAVGTWSVAGAPVAGQVAIAAAAAAAQEMPPTSGNALPEFVGPIRGRFLEQWFHSAALDRLMRYFIYLPPGYDTSGRLYPTLYLLHGAAGLAEEWPAYGFVNRLDAGILARTLNPFIAVLPEGEFGYWLNHADDGPRWGDYLTYDVVTDVDAHYRTLPYPAARAIGGHSMGGAGGLVQAFTHPSIFGTVGAHSPSLRGDNSVVDFLGEGAEFAARDPVSLARAQPGLDRLRIWLDAGEDDQFYARTLALHSTLVERGVPHEWHPFPGEHYDGYWIQHTPEYLGFYSRALGSNS